MNTFEQFNLPKALDKALNELNITTPTPIQVKSLPVILSGRDMMGIAQTGTGKTFAYLLPILKQWKFANFESPRVVIIVPTRELVVQVVDVIEKITQYMSIRTLGVYGGTNINTQRKAVYEGVDILVGTPGRMMDLALDGVLRFDNLQKLVIDEFDEILNLGFRTQLTSILTMMKTKRQNILFSATMTEEVDEVLDEYFDFPEEVSLAPSGTPLEKIDQLVYNVPNFNTKMNLLLHLLQDKEVYNRVLIFINSKRLADVVMEKLEAAFPDEFTVIHSNKSQNFRMRSMAEFQASELRGLLTTDIMARGLDISDISHVFNLQFTDSPEQYIHRIGRTGRADKKGTAISLVDPKEEEMLIAAEMLMEKELTVTEIPEEVEISTSLMEFEKSKLKAKQLVKIKKPEEKGAAFHQKKEKNTKVNLGGPGKRKPRKTKPRNRAVDAKRAAKKKRGNE
ncbi:DEAD/DEAH box helicase [Myroides albus]|uniref:DEAD/DEAH box helicase n=1 Tax=Myroides albus TaxID=2562892 RepID=A0A6I3LPB5_9FLAO|nr:DEAD/DEAH box helicase [Myroides albus]MTG97982.1 DEAD/DEAH box helicase [Myroides albus]UVD80273.1 DEAD/DEAH box helicase [Myroides albus]